MDITHHNFGAISHSYQLFFGLVYFSRGTDSPPKNLGREGHWTLWSSCPAPVAMLLSKDLGSIQSPVATRKIAPRLESTKSGPRKATSSQSIKVGCRQPSNSPANFKNKQSATCGCPLSRGHRFQGFLQACTSKAASQLGGYDIFEVSTYINHPNLASGQN